MCGGEGGRERKESGAVMKGVESDGVERGEGRGMVGVGRGMTFSIEYSMYGV